MYIPALSCTSTHTVVLHFGVLRAFNERALKRFHGRTSWDRSATTFAGLRSGRFPVCTGRAWRELPPRLRGISNTATYDRCFLYAVKASGTTSCESNTYYVVHSEVAASKPSTRIQLFRERKYSRIDTDRLDELLLLLACKQYTRSFHTLIVALDVV